MKIMVWTIGILHFHFSPWTCLFYLQSWFVSLRADDRAVNKTALIFRVVQNRVRVQTLPVSLEILFVLKQSSSPLRYQHYSSHYKLFGNFCHFSVSLHIIKTIVYFVLDLDNWSKNTVGVELARVYIFTLHTFLHCFLFVILFKSGEAKERSTYGYRYSFFF